MGKHIGMLLGVSLAAMAWGPLLAQDNAGATDLDAIRRMAEQGQWQEALQRLDSRIETDTDATDVQARFLKGLLLLEHDRLQEAREVFLDITRLFPRLPGGFNNLAVIYAREGEYEKARQALALAIANAPDYSASHANLGDIYTKLALDAYRRAVELDPQDEISQGRLEWLENLFYRPEPADEPRP